VNEFGVGHVRNAGEPPASVLGFVDSDGRVSEAGVPLELRAAGSTEWCW
jgi:hypothetical protein